MGMQMGNREAVGERRPSLNKSGCPHIATHLAIRSGTCGPDYSVRGRIQYKVRFVFVIHMRW